MYGRWLAIMAMAATVTMRAQNAAPADVVRAYLEALKALDAHTLESYWADDARVLRNGAWEPVSRGQADMRDFERVMHTKWTYRIDSVSEEGVTAVMTEENDFYDALGVGKRTQVITYVVKDGKIVEIRPVSMQQEHGTYLDEYRRFRAWLQRQQAGNDPDIMRDGDFVFTSRSAEKMRPWLDRYRTRPQ